MGGINVKNTIIEKVLQIVAPHPCSGCGKIGALLCNDCKYDIISEPFLGCILCARPHEDGICVDHQTSFSQVYVVGVRVATLKRLIDALKFHNTKAAAKELAVLLHERLPILPLDTLIVPVPTVASHIRQRGYDHVELIAQHLALLRGLTVERALVRQGTATQHIATRATRRTQADEAFMLANSSKAPGREPPVLLIDDIITTGATVQAAANVLAGAYPTVLVAALAYHPLD